MAATARNPITPTLLNETKPHFQRNIKELQAWHKIPEDLIINCNQIPLPCVCTGKFTLGTDFGFTILFLINSAVVHKAE